MAIALTLASGAYLAGLPGAIFGVPLVASINAAVQALARPTIEVETTGLPPPAEALPTP
jgi:predicted PurR-regulated permease PerM